MWRAGTGPCSPWLSVRPFLVAIRTGCGAWHSLMRGWPGAWLDYAHGVAACWLPEIQAPFLAAPFLAGSV